MISNERQWPSRNSSRDDCSPTFSQPPVDEVTLKTEKLQIERKTFVFTLKENARGRFLRITEDAGGRRDTIIIPASGLEDFKTLLNSMVKLSKETPVKEASGNQFAD